MKNKPEISAHEMYQVVLKMHAWLDMSRDESTDPGERRGYQRSADMLLELVRVASHVATCRQDREDFLREVTK